MEWVETTAKTVEEAKDAALDQLGVDEQDAEFDVVEEPRTGLFGRTRGEARVRARVAPRAQRPKQERRRKPAAKADGVKATPAKATATKAATKATAAKPPRKAAAKAAPVADEPAELIEDEEAVPTAPDEVTAPPAKRARPARGAAQAKESQPQSEATASAAPATNHSASAAEGRNSMEDSVTVEEQAEIMEEFLVGLLDAFGVDGEVSSQKVDDETVEIDITGDDLGLLIGPKGLTLQAVQDMARTVVQRQAAGHHEGRIRVDIGGYRQRRREALARFATQVAEQVRAGGSAKSLEPMNAADRKVVHDTVNDLDGVHTRSDGVDPDRWVVILPDEG